MEMDTMERHVLATITPTQEEKNQLDSLARDFIKQLQSLLEGAEVLLGGSVAKDTWLSQTHDLDVFVLFDYSTFKEQSANLSNILEPKLQKAFSHCDIKRVHGSRDYFRLVYRDVQFEVVPILQIARSQEALNITDVSPLHSAWVNANTDALKDDIRLAKQFCRAHGLYGAESHIQGFSGYVLEILIAYYGGFRKLLQASAKWKERQIIDIEEFYPKGDALFHLNSSKTKSALVVIDPVDKDRNAAAALSSEKCQEFQTLAAQYLKEPLPEFFVREPLTVEKVRQIALERKCSFVCVEVVPPEGKNDVVGMKLIKVLEHLARELDVFDLVDKEWDWVNDRALLCLYLKEAQLPEFEERQGPPLSIEAAAHHFRETHKDVFEKEGRLYARIAHEIRDLKQFVGNVLEHEYIKERVEQIKDVIVS